MTAFGQFALDKEKDILVELSREGEALRYLLRTPNHGTGNLIRNLARLCRLPLSEDGNGLMVIRGTVPSYVDGDNRQLWIFRLGNTKVANIRPDGSVELKASIPAISKALMSQTKDYRLSEQNTIVKTYIFSDCKFRTDLHTHMSANLPPELLIALGIRHQIRYPLYYIRKLGLRVTAAQQALLDERRAAAEQALADSALTGKYRERRIDDNTFINFADLILNNPADAAWNISRIRISLAVPKDGQAVFADLEKVYLYRYVFTKGQPSGQRIRLNGWQDIPDGDITYFIGKMREDRHNPAYKNLSLFQNKLLWIARSMQRRGVVYAEISDTTLVKKNAAAHMLREVHELMPKVTAETGVTLRFLAAIRRIPLTIIRDKATAQEDIRGQLRVIRAIAADPYVAGSDIIGEEINDIRDLREVLRGLVAIAGENKGFVIRIHAGENDSLRDNVANSLACVRESLAKGQKMPPLRIGHGLYTANLHSQKGQQLIRELRESGAVLEFQLTSNVRLNNLTSLKNHPLRQYLSGGVACVQGTDGGALYGTDSIDEQLALERLLDLSYEEMCRMRAAEDKVLKESMKTFAAKQKRFEKLTDGREIEAFWQKKIDRQASDGAGSEIAPQKCDSASCLKEQIREIPTDKVPVILLGGSFNSSSHATRIKQPLRELLAELVGRLDPKEVCFVLGSRLTGYERELLRLAKDKFEIFAIVPTCITSAELQRIRQSGVGVRVSIEPTRMGLYKSFAYEIFKRRPSVVIALDGNSAGANTIQEAKNGKREARIFVYRHARVLSAKAQAIQGYVSFIESREDADIILASVNRVRDAMQYETPPKKA